MHTSPEKVVEVVQGFEYTLQWLWEFPLDKNKHSYWNKVAGCTCSKDDNDQMFGTGLRWEDNNCPYHGGKTNDNL